MRHYLTDSKVKVPTLGHSGILTSYVTAVKFFLRSKDMLREGYAMCLGKGDMFNLADLHGWKVYVCGPRLISEMAKIPDEILGALEATRLVSLPCII